MTVLVCSCDKYEDTWQTFAKLLKKYWPDFDYRLILNTESKNFEYDGLSFETFNLYESGQNVDYGERIRAHLKRITTPYTLLLLDDFFIREPVDTKKIKEIIGYMDNDPAIATFNFDFIADPHNKEAPYPGFILRPEVCQYKLNMQAGIWRTDVLYDLWRDSDSPWVWELYGTCRSFNNKYKYYCLSDLSFSPIKYGKEKVLFGVFKGKWIKDDVCPLFEKEGIEIDLEKRGFYTDDCKSFVLGGNHSDRIKTACKALPKKYFVLWLRLSLKNKIKQRTSNNDTEDFIDYLIHRKYK